MGAVDLGFSPAGTRIRKKVSGKTKVEVRDKLRELHKELDVGLRPRRRYTVGDALEDWLAHGTDGLSERAMTLYRGTIVKALNEELGGVRLTELTASDVYKALTALASRSSTRTVQIAHNVLVRAIRHAERDDLVGRNVAALLDTPKGQLEGRPSKSLTLEQTVALMAAAKGNGARGLHRRVAAFRSADRGGPGAAVGSCRDLGRRAVAAGERGRVRSRAGGGVRVAGRAGWRGYQDAEVAADAGAVAECVEALREHRERQAKDRLSAGAPWKDHGLVFASAVGTPLDDHNVRRQFRVITEAAGLGKTWVPRELRHTFVSLLSAHGVPVEAIALLAGHNQTATTELVYRHQIVPALTRGAEVMDQIFG